MTFKITIATEQDLEKVKDHGGAFIGRSISSGFVSYEGAGFIAILKAMIKYNAAVVWVCHADDGDFAGAICLLIGPNIYNPKERMGDIYFINVLPKYQGRGVAKQMMATVEMYAGAIGVKSLTVSFKQKDIADRVASGMDYTMFEYKLIKRINKEI